VDLIQYPGGLSGIGIRGFRPEFSGTNQHVLILIDGHDSGATTFGNLPNAAIERIEVLKGPASSLYGASAMGGVVNIITKHSSGPVTGTFAVGYGSFETVVGDASIGGSVGDFDFDLALNTTTQFDDFKMGNGQTRPNTSFANHSGSLRVGYKLSDAWRVEIRTSGFLGLDVESPGAYTDGISAQGSKDVSLFTGDLSLHGEIEHHLIQATVYGSREYDKRRDETAGRPAFRNTLRTTTFRGAQLQDSWKLIDSFTLTYGLDLQEVKNDNRSYLFTNERTRPISPDDERDTVGYFVDGTAKFFRDTVVLNAGVRYDDIDLNMRATPFRPDVVPGSTRLPTTNPRVGLVYLPSKGWRIHTTAGRAFVAPLATQLAGFLDETVSGQRRITRGNANLNPESAWTYDAGLGYDSRIFSADATWFYTKLNDKIESVFVTNTTTLRDSTYVNADRAQSSGLELALAADLGSAFGSKQGLWRLSSSYTHLFQREQQLPAGTSVLRNVAKDKLNAAVTYAPGKFTVRANARYVRGVFDQDNSKLLVFTGGKGGVFEYPTNVVWDLFASYRVTSRQTVSLIVDNIFDRFYYEKNDYPLAGRAFTARYRLDF
jgi:outer membrane receptor protein involved in Fe transport